MLKIYNTNHDPLGYIIKYKDLKIESDLETGDKSLIVEYTALSKAKEIKEEYYIATKDDEYVVKSVEITDDGTQQISAAINLEELEGKVWEEFLTTELTIKEAGDMAALGTGWRVAADSGLTQKRTVCTTKKNTLEICKALKDAYMCEVEFDSKQKIIHYAEQLGKDRGVYFFRQINLKDLKKTSKTYDYYTRIIPIGADGLRIGEVNDGKDYLENFQYTNKIKEYIWEDSSYTDPEKLMEDAAKKLADLSRPKISYSASVRNLRKQRPEYAHLVYGLGDTIILADFKTQIRDKQRIVKMTEYPQDPEKDTCELSNTVLTFEEFQQKLKDAAAILDNVTTDDGTLKGSAVDKITIGQIVDFGTEVAKYTTGYFNELQTDYLYVAGELGATKAQVGEIYNTYLKSTEAEMKYATIERANIIDAKVNTIDGDFATFKSTTTETLAANVAAINVVSGSLASYKEVVADEITAAKGWMLESSIGSAQISSLDAAKINAGIINTALVQIVGSDGRMQIADNTILIKDATRERALFGKDGSGEYTVAIWDKDGKLIFDALGATENTIQRKIIRDNMVSDDANIQGYKLDIQSVVTSINGSTTKLDSTVVQVGNKTLTVALQEQSQTITDNAEQIKTAYSKIEANENAISLKVNESVYNAFTQSTNGQITTINKSLSDAGSAIDAVKGSITAKVWQTDITSAINNIEIGSEQILKGTNTDIVLTSAGTWADGTWRQASGGTGNRNKITITDAPNPNIKYGWELSSVAGFNTDIAQDNIAVTQGQTYTMSCYARVISGTPTLRLQYGTNPYPSKTFTLTNTTWQRFSFTFTPDWSKDGSGTGKTNIYFGISTATGVLQICGEKLETGNKATDHSRATEEITTTKQLTSAINVAIDNITLSVSQTYSTKTDLTDAIDGIGIGGRNIIKETEFKSLNTSVYAARNAYATLSVDTTNKHNCNNSLKIVASVAGASGADLQFTTMKPDQSGSYNIRISFWAKSSVGNNKFYWRWGFGSFAEPIVVGTTWQKFEIQLNATATHGANLHPYFTQISTMWISELMIEYGTKSSDWTPAPEDVSGEISSLETWKKEASQIITKDGITNLVGTYYAKTTDLNATNNRVTVAESSITQLNNNINLMVKEADVTGNYLVSKINISPSTVKIDAKNIALTGNGLIEILNTGTTTISASKINLNGLVTANENFKILSDGSMVAKNGEFNGKLTANSGTIAQFSISSNCLSTASGYIKITGVNGTAQHIDGYSVYELDGCKSSIQGNLIKITDNNSCVSSVQGNQIKITDDATTRSVYIGTTTDNLMMLKLTNGTTTTQVLNDRITTDGYITAKGDITTKGAISSEGNIKILKNGKYLRGITTGGTEVRALGVSTSNNLILGTNELTDTNSAVYNNNNYYVAADKEHNFYVDSTRVFRVDYGGIESKATYSRTTTASANLYILSTGTMWRSTSSSKRYKHSIEAIQPEEYKKIYDMPVDTFIYRTKEACPDGGLDQEDYLYNKRIPGFIAEKVEEHIPLAAEYNDKGEVEMFNQKILFPMTVAAVQNNHREIQNLWTENARLNSQLLLAQAQITTMAAEINELKMKA